MHIKNPPAAAYYKLALGTLALFAYFVLFAEYSFAAFRLFPTWVLLLAAVYYLWSAFDLAMHHRRDSGKNPCPLLEGMIINNFIFLAGVALTSYVCEFPLVSLHNWLVFVIVGLLPVLAFTDWLLFVKKGRWRPMMPFYWLALPLCYAATIIFTAEFLPGSAQFRFPFWALNYPSFGFWPMLLCLLVISLLMLTTGYLLYLLDFATCGRLARFVVLPHIRVVTIEDEALTQPAVQPTTTTPSQPEVINLTPETEKTSKQPSRKSSKAKSQSASQRSRSSKTSTSKSSKSKTVQPSKTKTHKPKSRKPEKSSV